MRNTQDRESGFVALITAISLSLILLTVAVALNQSGFFTRSTLLEAEYKEQSLALADACVDTALLRLAADPTYGGNETIQVGDETCEIRPVSHDAPVAGQDTIETRAIVREATTNVRVIIDAIDLTVVSWDEIAAF